MSDYDVLLPTSQLQQQYSGYSDASAGVVPALGYGSSSSSTSGYYQPRSSVPEYIGSNGNAHITTLRLDGHPTSGGMPLPIGTNFIASVEAQPSPTTRDVSRCQQQQQPSLTHRGQGSVVAGPPILPQTTKDAHRHYYEEGRPYYYSKWRGPKNLSSIITPFCTTLVIGLLLTINTLFLLYIFTTYVPYTYIEEQHHRSEQQFNSIAAATATATAKEAAAAAIEPQPYHVRSSNVGAGESFHDHVYSTYHYEFILDARVGSWIRYPNKGGLEDIVVDQLMSFTLCCHGGGGRFLCKNTNDLQAEMRREFDSKDVYLSVLIRDSALESRQCILTYTMDQYEDS